MRTTMFVQLMQVFFLKKNYFYLGFLEYMYYTLILVFTYILQLLLQIGYILVGLVSDLIVFSIVFVLFCFVLFCFSLSLSFIDEDDDVIYVINISIVLPYIFLKTSFIDDDDVCHYF